MDVRLLILAAMTVLVLGLGIWWSATLLGAFVRAAWRRARPGPARGPHPLRRLAQADWICVTLIVPLAAWPLWPEVPGDDLRLGSALRAELATVREATRLYAAQHDGRLPDGAVVVPANPVSGSAEVCIVPRMPALPLDVDGGWLYCPATGEWRANVAGANAHGVAWFDL